MTTLELRSEKARISSKIEGLKQIASVSWEAEMQIDMLNEELKWIQSQIEAREPLVHGELDQMAEVYFTKWQE